MTRPSSKFCAEQVARLRVFPTFPKQSKIARMELVGTLVAHTKSEDHCKRVMDRAVIEGGRDGGWCPLPGDLARLAEEVPVSLDVPAGCDLCQGTGWRYFERVIQDPITGRILTTDHSCRCVCAKGRHLREMDLLRTAK